MNSLPAYRSFTDSDIKKFYYYSHYPGNYSLATF